MNSLEIAVKHLTRHDPILAPVILISGPYTVQPHGKYYQELVESIISQQLSVKAAATILKRFIDLFGGTFPSPDAILQKSVEEFRSVGLSRPKGGYILDLAQHVVDGKVKFDHFDSLTNQQILDELTKVKGIGIWTVHMFLIFCMGRLDVLAYGDLGIRNGIQKLYSLETLPDQQTIEALAIKNNWHPYESVACWYIWKSVDTVPTI